MWLMWGSVGVIVIGQLRGAVGWEGVMAADSSQIWRDGTRSHYTLIEKVHAHWVRGANICAA